jgi:hypothetical protein
MGMNFDVHAALVGLTAMTIQLQKLVDTAKPTQSEAKAKSLEYHFPVKPQNLHSYQIG